MSAVPTDRPAFHKALSAARKESAQSGSRLITALQDQSGLDQASFMAWLEAAVGYKQVQMQDLGQWSADFELLGFSECLQHDLLPMRTPQGELCVVIADPFSEHLRERVWAKLREPFEFRLAHLADIQAYFSKQEESRHAMQGWSPASQVAEADYDAAEVISLKSIAEVSSPIVSLVNATLYDALKEGASDIHLESSPNGLLIKYRIDGVLVQMSAASGVATAEQVISRIKVMSDLDISERRIPQDGRFKVKTKDRTVDMRVSIMPSIFGEDAVLRILDKEAITGAFKELRLDTLGFDADMLSALRRVIREPYGMFLVTGPTGSGKTTTLYAAISEINQGFDKIITIEDPVEYQLPGVLQIPVNEKKGLTFARGLRSVLRHDPDKIMIGEIRDSETAQIAIQSALTGHLVFTTVHANNVFDVLGRFLHMGVDATSFVSALNAILAQRLVRINCKACSQAIDPDSELLERSGINRSDLGAFRFRAGRGCGQCRGTGFHGRKAIAELLILDDEIREMISSRQPIRAIKGKALEKSMRFLRESAIALVKSGETTLQEINRVTFVD